MLKARLEKTRKTEIGPLMEIGLYNDDDRCEYSAAVVMHDDLQFICYRMERGAVLQSTLGNSGGLKNYEKIATSKITVKEKKSIIHGQIVLAVVDFIGIIYDLFGEDIECPYGLSKRFMTDALDDFINLCYKQMMNSVA